MSLTHLAGLLGINKQYLSQIELGKVNFTSDYLDTIIKKLPVTAHEFHYQGIPFPKNSK
jgi:transcriptional regulator with XRE-family HTH domain